MAVDDVEHNLVRVFSVIGVCLESVGDFTLMHRKISVRVIASLHLDWLLLMVIGHWNILLELLNPFLKHLGEDLLVFNFDEIGNDVSIRVFT